MWVIFALLTSMIDAIYNLGKQTTSLSATLFILYRGYITAILAFPFLFFFPAPQYWEFYALCIIQGSIVAFNDYINFKGIKRYGAEIVASIQPLSTGLLFFAWLIISPSTLGIYLSNKIIFSLIMLSLFGIIYSVYKYNQQEICKQALKYLFPMLITSMFINIINKLTTQYGSITPLATGLYYSFTLSLTVGIVNTFALKGNIQNLKECYKNLNIKVFLLFILMLSSMISKNIAMGLALNPTYVSAIIYLAILWTILGNLIIVKLKLATAYPHIKWRYVALLVISCASLIILTN